MGYMITPEQKYSGNQDYRNYIIMNKSNHSYMLNNKIIDVFNSKSWSGRRCFILAGGESLKGLDFTPLKNELTIGINKAFQYYPDTTINYSMDSDFYSAIKDGRYDEVSGEKLLDKWKAYNGTRVFLTPMDIREYGKEVFLIRRNIDFRLNTSLQDGIYGGRNSGFGAVMLARSLGCMNIFLLGYDMKAKETSHWHGGYPNRDLKDFNNKLTGYKQEFQEALPYLMRDGVTITNLSQDSELKCFNYDKLENVLRN
jgi:hypothetical protein